MRPKHSKSIARQPFEFTPYLDRSQQIQILLPIDHLHAYHCREAVGAAKYWTPIPAILFDLCNTNRGPAKEFCKLIQVL